MEVFYAIIFMTCSMRDFTCDASWVRTEADTLEKCEEVKGAFELTLRYEFPDDWTFGMRCVRQQEL